MASGSGSRSVKPVKGRTGGRQTVIYRDSRGRTHDAKVVGGSGTSLNLQVRGGGGGNRLLTGIAKATAPHQTNKWY